VNNVVNYEFYGFK